jgi:hypothetical protein
MVDEKQEHLKQQEVLIQTGESLYDPYDVCYHFLFLQISLISLKHDLFCRKMKKEKSSTTWN